MKLEEIAKIIEMFERANITSLDIEVDGMKIKLEKTENQVISSNVSNVCEKEDGNIVKSPLVGTYHQSPYAEAMPFVSVGSEVCCGDKLCIIEAMKVMNEIKAPKAGVITQVFLNEGDNVEYDQALFAIGDANV